MLTITEKAAPSAVSVQQYLRARERVGRWTTRDTERLLAYLNQLDDLLLDELQKAGVPTLDQRMIENDDPVEQRQRSKFNYAIQCFRGGRNKILLPV